MPIDQKERSTDLPALRGGPPVRPQGPHDWPRLDFEVVEALSAALAKGTWGKYDGGHVTRLEAELTKIHSVPFSLACASGTFAVETALRALQLSPDDEVIVSAYDYEPNFLCAHAVGATPVLADVAPHNWNLDPNQLQAAIGPNTKAILVSHLHGGLAPMRE